MSELPSSGDLDPCSRHHTAEHAYTLNYEEPINPALNILAIDPFAVLGDGLELGKAVLDEELVGQTLVARSHKALDTPIGALATAEDSRIAVLTGQAGKFETMVDLLPEPGLDMNINPPAAVMTLIESLERFTAAEASRGEGASE